MTLALAVSVSFAFCQQVVSSNETQAQEDDPHTVRFQFEPSLYQCFENCGSLKLTVARHGGDAGVTAKVKEPLWRFCPHPSNLLQREPLKCFLLPFQSELKENKYLFTQAR